MNTCVYVRSLKVPSSPVPAPARLVCLVLLKHLDLRREVAWCESLKRVKSIIGGVDYKVEAPSHLIGDELQLALNFLPRAAVS